MDQHQRDADLEPEPALAGEPAFFGHQATAADHPHLPPSCPGCGSLELVSEPAQDEDEAPTGMLLISCSACGRELGQIAPPESAS